MSNKLFFKINNILDTNIRLKEAAKYYREKKLNGLHYVNFLSKGNIISISKPNFETHHFATSFLLSQKFSGYSINPVKAKAHDLKKFLDYLLIWDLEHLNVDLLILLISFIDYLKIVQGKKDNSINALPNLSIEWAMIKRVPLNETWYTNSKVTQIRENKIGKLEINATGDLSSNYIARIVSTALQYIYFLKHKTNQFRYIDIDVIPKKEKYISNMLSGTLSNWKHSYYDISYLLNTAGIRSKKRKALSSLSISFPLFNLHEVEEFIENIKYNQRQNKFLFYVLKCFGLRRGELSNLMLDFNSLPTNLRSLNDSDLKTIIKKSLKGDIEFSNNLNKWICKVYYREENTHFDSQNKSMDREIPLIFNSQDKFTELFIHALKEREALMKYSKTNHNYLFVSRSNNNRGNRITGNSVSKKLSSTVKSVFKSTDGRIDFTSYSPHTFRHFFATHNLRNNSVLLDDISRWLGHQSVEVTRMFYIHYLPNPKDGDQKIQDIINTLKKN